MKRTVLIILNIILVLLACKEDNPPAQNTYTFTFETDMEGWTGDFADYPIGAEEQYELNLQHTSLPAPLNTSEGALMQTGSNQSDDLFMFIKKKITGLAAAKTYTIDFTVEFASNSADGMAGIGGSPGESVYIKAGAMPTEPLKVEDDMGYYRMNIDKGNQSQGGSDMIVTGDFSNDTEVNEYTLVTRTNQSVFQAQADSNGEIWIAVGTDSGFEGTTTIYYNTISVTFR
jgi:hypothetical protein